MQTGQLKRLSDKICYLPASEAPLSADVFFIEAGSVVYIYDVGSSAAARERIEAVKQKKIAVLSHFHADHTANAAELTFEALYAGRETLRHTGCGIPVDGEILLEESVPIRLVPLPSSHAKDCVVLCYGTEYAFCGDAVYAAGKKFPAKGTEAYAVKRVYNSQKLKAMLEALKRLDAKYLVLSHDKRLVYPKEEVIRPLEMIYKRRDKNSAYIEL